MTSSKRIWTFTLLLIGAVGLAIAANQIRFFMVFQPIQSWIYGIEEAYQHHFNPAATRQPFVLPLLAFGGGLIASISPCILALLPINLSYIGTREITSRRDALFKASLFVLGVITVLSLLGLVSAFAGAVMVQYRGYINLAVGVLMVLMGLNLLKVLHIPLPQVELSLPFGNPLGNPYSFGVAFALVISPCASPILMSVLAAAATTGSQLSSVLVMVSYALGYTLIIFLASVLTGLAKQTQMLLKRAETILQVGGGALLVIGLYYIINGGHWLMLIW